MNCITNGKILEIILVVNAPVVVVVVVVVVVELCSKVRISLSELRTFQESFRFVTKFCVAGRAISSQNTAKEGLINF